MRQKKPIDIPYPFGGLDKSGTFSDQKLATSRDLKNVVGVDEQTLRRRGGSRAGMTEFLDVPDVAGDVVKRMDTVVTNNRAVDYAYQTEPPSVFAIAPDADTTIGSNTCRVVRVDEAGDVYWLIGKDTESTAWVKTNSYGEVLWTQVIDLPDNQLLVTGFWVDEHSAVYASVGTRLNFPTGMPETGEGLIWKWILDGEGTGYQLAWMLTLPIGAGVISDAAVDLFVHQETLYTLERHWTGSVWNTVVRWYEDNGDSVYPDHALSQSFTLSQTTITGSAAAALLGTAFARRKVTSLEFFICGEANGGTLTGTDYWLAKYNGDGTYAFHFYNDVTTNAAPNIGAIGYGVQSDAQGNIISIGPGSATTNEGVWLRRIVDQLNGGSYPPSPTATGCWRKTGSMTAGSVYARHIHFAVDSNSTVYAPYALNAVSGGASAQRAISVYDVDGNLLMQSDVSGTYAGNPRWLAMGTAIPPELPLHTPVYGEDDIQIAEFVYAGANYSSGNALALNKRRLLTVTGTSGSPRTFVNTLVAGGNLKTFSRAGGFDVPEGGITGTGCLLASPDYVSSAVLLGKQYLTDGVNDIVYDPTATVAAPHGTVSLWTPTTTGLMPPRARLLFAWRARMGRARCPDDPHNFYLSAAEDPLDWNTGPAVPSSGMAMAGNLTPAGRIPDLPNAFFDYSDDLLVAWCDHTTWMVSGNPLKGGEIDLVSPTIGGSFGKPGCVDDDGILYWHANTCGIYAMAPGGKPQRITSGTADADLSSIDLEANYVELVWDSRLQAIHVFVFPFGPPTALLRHWRFEKRTGAWIPMEFGRTGDRSAQPTAVLVIDGDAPTDRTIILAGEDEHLGYLDSAAKDDRGHAIASSVLIGPIVPRGASAETAVRLCEVMVTLASNLGGCLIEVFATDTADVLGKADAVGELHPGINRIKLRAKGQFIYLRLFQAKVDTRWAVEAISAFAYPAGRVRA